MLTDIRVRQAKPAEKPQYLFDGGGLYLQVNRNGSRWWRYKYRFGGRQKLLSLGVYPDISLREARERHAAARSLLTQGIDPSEQRKTDKVQAKITRSNRFSAIAEVWYQRKVKEWAPSTAAKVRAYLDSDLLPVLGDRPMPEIRRRDLIELLAKIEQRGAFDVAKKCREWLSGIFRYALVTEIIDSNPATDLYIVAGASPKTRQYPHLPESDLSGFLRALDAYRGEPSTVRAIKLLLLTGCRPGELRGATWDEIDFDAMTWTIPAERMKMRRPHLFPLPQQAIDFLLEQRQITGHRDLIFGHRDKDLLPMSENTMGVAINRIGYKGRQTAHGFRHLVSTALNERGYNRDWIERQLAHGDDNEIRAVYNKAEYLEQRRVMMQEWADLLETLSQLHP